MTLSTGKSVEFNVLTFGLEYWAGWNDVGGALTLNSARILGENPEVDLTSDCPINFFERDTRNARDPCECVTGIRLKIRPFPTYARVIVWVFSHSWGIFDICTIKSWIL